MKNCLVLICVLVSYLSYAQPNNSFEAELGFSTSRFLTGEKRSEQFIYGLHGQISKSVGVIDVVSGLGYSQGSFETTSSEVSAWGNSKTKHTYSILNIPILLRLNKSENPTWYSGIYVGVLFNKTLKAGQSMRYTNGNQFDMEWDGEDFSLHHFRSIIVGKRWDLIQRGVKTANVELFVQIPFVSNSYDSPKNTAYIPFDGLSVGLKLGFEHAFGRGEVQ